MKAVEAYHLIKNVRGNRFIKYGVPYELNAEEVITMPSDKVAQT